MFTMKAAVFLAVFCFGSLAAARNVQKDDVQTVLDALGGVTRASPTSQLAILGDVPYLVSVWVEWESIAYPNTTYTTFSCTGALVHPEYVLTTYDCVERAMRGYDKVLLAAGHLNGEDPTGLDFHPLVDHIKHELYDPWTGLHNIALIKVDPPFEESSFIKVVPVRSAPATLDMTCTISGWKEDYFDTSEFLKIDEVRYLEKEECDYIWIEEETYPYEICAGIPQSEADGVCNVGDEGSPLVCDGQLTGLLFDTEVTVCISGEPSVYLDMSMYYEWITNSIAIGPTTTVSTVPTTTPTTTRTTTPTTTNTPPTTTPDPNVDVALGDLPYHVSVWQLSKWNNENNTYFYCTGTLIHNEFIVTTYRCAEEASRGGNTVLIAAGHLEIENNLDFHPVIEIIPHEDYDTWTYLNDIALLKVSPEFATTTNVSPATIRTTPVALGVECTISGWKENYFDTSDVLRASKVNVLNKTHCKYLYEDEPEIYVTKLCAGIPKGTPGEKCNVGDEGGPLYCEWQLTGIYSDFPVVCTTSDPAIYLDVEHFSPWILGKIATYASATTTTVRSTTDDHPTGEIGGGGAAATLSSSLALTLLLAVITYVNTRN